MMTKMHDLFEDTSSLAGVRLNGSSINWHSLGIKRKYAIFFTGRCGSTWLTHLLADSGLLGRPEEFFNEDFISHFCRQNSISTLSGYISAIISKFTTANCFGFEIDPIRYKDLAALVDFSEIFIQPDSALFYMTREDILSQAYSFAMAKKTGIWHDFSERTPETNQRAADISDVALWGELFLILEQEQYIKEEFRRLDVKPIPITYEELLTDKYSVVTTMMIALGVASADIQEYLPKITDKTRKIGYAAKHRVLGEFLERNWRAYEILLVSRGSSNIDGLRASLKEYHGIDIGPFRRLRRA